MKISTYLFPSTSTLTVFFCLVPLENCGNLLKRRRFTTVSIPLLLGNSNNAQHNNAQQQRCNKM